MLTVAQGVAAGAGQKVSEHVLDNAKDLVGKKVIDFNGNGVAQCAELLRANGTPPASTWRRGIRLLRIQ